MRRSNKKWIIALVAVLVLLVAIYFLSPMYTVHRFINAASKGDKDGMIECIEPETAKTLTSISNFIDALGMDSLISSLITGGGDTSESENSQGDNFKNKKYSFSEFKLSFKEKTSSVKLTMTSKDDKEDSTSMVVHFVWIDFKWYIQSISDIEW